MDMRDHEINSLFLEFTEKETKSQVKRLKFVPFKKARLLSVFVKKFLGKSEYPSTLIQQNILQKYKKRKEYCFGDSLIF